ncbi:MAG: T9SS type A sorting domain-containing protein [Bacteroidetes bacterium]|nr:T9SS type A sorting domain-containing protein [Bacteroidota bacterium]
MRDDVLLINPNPSSGLFNIQVKTKEKSYLSISNIFGNLLFRSNIIPGNNIEQLSVDLSTMANGIYLINLQIENGVAVQKLLILNK